MIVDRPLRGEALRAHRKAFSVRLKNVRSDRSYECTRNRVNVFDTGITLPGRSDLSLAAATLCRLQLCTVLGSLAGKKSCLCSTQSVRGWTTDISNVSLSFFPPALPVHFFIPSVPPSSHSLLFPVSLPLIFPFLLAVSFFHCQFLCFYS